MLLMSVCMYAQELYGEYEKKVYVSSQGDSLKYRLLRPEAEKAGKKYPLVLFLHGAGERGDDNQKQLVHGGQMWLNPVNREEYPAFVLAPQCPKEDYWAYVGRPKSFVPGEMPEVQEPTRIFRTLKELLDTYLAMPQVDKDRIYVMGLSMGGRGTFGFGDTLSRSFCRSRSHLWYCESGKAFCRQRREVPYLSRRCR